MKKKFLNTKNVVIGLVSLVLIGASATGVAVFLKDRGEAAAAEQEQVQNLPATGRGEDNNQTGENTTIPSENNTTGDNTQIPTEPSTTEGATPGETTRPGTTGTTTRSRTEEAVAGIEETVRIEERKVFEDLKLSWTTLAIPAITADMGIFKPVLGIEKTATAVVRANQEEQIPVTENNKPMVRAGDTIIYTIKVSNSGNYKATNVVVTDSLDVIFDGKIVPANKELVKIETLDAGKQATLKVGYVVKQEDINAVLETEQNETISKDIINIATATDGKTTVEDEDDMPVNPDVTINVNKNWQDNDNQDGKRPEKITVELYRNNENEPVETVTIDARSDWKHVFSNLPKYDEDKQEITYKVVEGTVPEYDTEYEITDNEVEIYNHHTPEKVSVEGSKIWDDADNQDGKRPSSIIVNLLADGEKVDSKTVTANDNWSWSFTNLDKYNSGTEIVYTISEDIVADYTTVVDGYNITNTHTPEKTTISGSKTWDDADNQDGKRPSSIIVNLLADGEKVDSKTVTASDNWSWSFTGLDKYNSGTEIVYTISEDIVADYTTVVDGYNITNTHTPEKISITGSKTWDDADNQDGKRPESITVRLFADGTEVKSKTVTANDNWSWSFTGLDKYNSGTEIVYTISEDTVADYTTVVDGYNITNTHTPEKISISGSKTWDDVDNQDGKRPESITVRLFADGTEVKSKTVTANDNWLWSFTGLDKYNSGTEIVYTISEDTVADYTTVVDGYNITNTHTPEKISISGSKTWDDNDNQDGKRPEKITVRLFADGTEVTSQTVTADNGWKWSFTDLDKYKKGKEIKYTVSEDAVTDYTTEVKGYNITNTHTPEKISISGSKTWDDNDNQDGKRPSNIKVILFADGTEVTSQTVTADNGWKWSFTDLDKYKKGKEIKYTVSEDAVTDYTTEVKGYNITNTHTPEKISISGSKTWDDNDNQDGKRPEKITVILFADGTEVTSQTITADNGWKWSFTDLDKYKKGKEIKYTVSEDAVTDYTTEVKGYNITNTHTPEKISISGSKTWDDNDNQDGKRPSNIKVILFADGTEVTSQTVTADNGWKWSFTGLDKYNSGTEIVYTISEDTVADYTTVVDGYNITNTHTPEKISISGSKTWDDADNQDGKRPSSIIVNLLADGEKVDSKTVTAENEWNWLFTDLNKYAKGREIQYTITEDKVENYITNIEKTENGYVVTNSYTPETTSISVEKVWEDKNNQDGVRPASIKVKLYMKILDNNIAVANKEPLELNASTFWKAEFKDLPKYAKGIEIKYIVKEVNEQADATIKGTEYKVAYDAPIINENGKYIKITNSYTPKTTSVSVEKVWEDKNNQDGVRPDSINVQLYKTVGTTTTSVEKVKLTNSKLTHTWTELPQYEKGTEIKYTVRELDSNGNPLEDGKQINGKSGTKYTVKYTTDENGKQIITNTYKRVTTSVSGTKTWVDYDNKYNSRPESITINLLANGEKVDSKTITPQNGSWTYEFDEGLPVYKNGQKITYTISEEEVSGYTSNVTGYNVTNTYTEAPKGTITMNWDTQSTTESPIPVDVVFVLDTSWSMTDKGSSRGTNMVKAVNNAIDEILRFNTNNRISVVGYSEYGVLNALKVQYKNTAHSSVLLPLGRYTANDGQNYLKKSERIDRYDSKTGKPIYDYWVETNIQGYAKKTRHFDAGTFTQAGIQKGAEQLTNSTGKTVKVDGKDVQRVPVIIVVSDGEPTVFSTNYTSPLSESEKVLGTSQLANTSAVYGYYTILTANYYKQRVTDAYNTPAKVFTIAMDLTTQYGKTVLNPNNTNVGSCKNWIETDTRNQIEDKEISQKLYKYLNNFKQDISVSCSVGFNKIEENKETKYIVKYENVTVVKNPYSNYSYADKAFADDGMTADDLKRAMIGSITETVSNKKTHNIDENDRKIGKVYLDKIDITKDFKLEIAGGKTYTSYEDAKKDELVGFDGEKYYVDLTKLIGKTVTVNYRQK